MIGKTLRSLWSEPRVAHPPGPIWRDWVLVGVIVIAALLEGLLRDDVVWPGFSTALAVGLAFVLPWRRRGPPPVLLPMSWLVHPAGIAADAAPATLRTRTTEAKNFSFLLMIYLQ